MLEILSLLIANIIPLYVLIGLGFIAGRYLDVNLHSVAIIAIYILAPIVNFGAMARMDFNPEFIALPFIIFTMSCIIGTCSYLIAQKVWKTNMANLIGMGTVTGNTMYFGLPVILALLGEEWVGVYALMNLGMFMNEIGLGYFFGARGNATLKGALLKMAKFPVIYAIILGLLYNLSGFALPESFLRYWNYSIGAWVIIGMMIIGIALSKQSRLDIDFKLLGSLLIPKFIIWPLFGALFVVSDLFLFQLFGSEVHQMFLIICCVPLAGNLVAYAATLNLYPEKAAAAVLIATVMAFVTVPAAIILYRLISFS